MRRLLIVTVIAVGLAPVASADALSPAPGWSIRASAEPTNFSAADSVGAMEELTVTGTAGTYRLEAARFGEQAPSPVLPFNASAAEVQTALEAMPEAALAGNFQITGGPASPQSPGPYVYNIAWRGQTLVGALGEVSGSSLSNGTNGKGEPIPGEVNTNLVSEARLRDRYTLTALNVGAAPAEGTTTITDRVPSGLVALEARIGAGESQEEACVVGEVVTCHFEGAIPPGGELRVVVTVAATSSVAQTVESTVTVSGGGSAAPASASVATALNGGAATFGIADFSLEPRGGDGQPDNQAGDHPFGLTTVLEFNTDLERESTSRYAVAQDVRSVSVTLPPGFYGNPLAAAQCPEYDLTTGLGPHQTACPAASQVGEIRVHWDGGQRPEGSYPVYNLVPEPGYPGELGINAGISQPIFLHATLVPSAAGYRLRISAPAIIRTGFDIEGFALTIFGDPAAHDHLAGHQAFLTSPANCGSGPLTAEVEATSWEGASATASSIVYPQLTGCELFQGAAAFTSALEVGAETSAADTPSGYSFDVKLPQGPNVFGALATPTLKNTTLTLPPGVTLSPSVASGSDALQGCAEAELAPQGMEVGAGHPGGNGSPYDDGLQHAAPGHCPSRSQVGVVSIRSPLVRAPLLGHVYVSAPSCGDAGQPVCTEAAAEEGRVFGLYLEAAGEGVVVKLKGDIEVGGTGARSTSTGLSVGQLRTRFVETPQLPVESVHIDLSGGQRAAIANPQECGVLNATAELEPWTAPASGEVAAVQAGVAISGCGAPRLSPVVVAGGSSSAAGAPTTFALTGSRSDGELNVDSVTAVTPPGLLGTLSSVELCHEPEASNGTCGAGSLIGHARAAIGSGSAPLTRAGNVYLTGPYGSAPFGLTVVVPAEAGPYKLGNVVVRAAIHIDPLTTALTVQSAHLPQYFDGLPLRIKELSVTIDRRGFLFNPTNCKKQTISTELHGTTPSGATQAATRVVTPFALTGCNNLPFKPKFSASTAGKASKPGGASLDVKVVSKGGPQPGGGEANIKSVKVNLPIQLPSRLTTLQKACLAATFEANPAGCPKESDVGTATAVTPVLAHPLSGPAYLVSHGGAAFPDLEIVLQGEGVTLFLVGNTNIKKGITSSTFKAVPDAPISSFELKLPTGKYSVLGTNLPASAKYSLCGQTLAMPTAITAQNGAVVKQTTLIEVQGCRNALSIPSHSIKGRTLSLSVSVPSAGKLTASGRGLSRTSRSSKGRETLKLTLRTKKAGKLKTTVRLSFAPTKGKKLSKSLPVKFKH